VVRPEERSGAEALPVPGQGQVPLLRGLSDRLLGGARQEGREAEGGVVEAAEGQQEAQEVAFSLCCHGVINSRI